MKNKDSWYPTKPDWAIGRSIPVVEEAVGWVRIILVNFIFARRMSLFESYM